MSSSFVKNPGLPKSKARHDPNGVDVICDQPNYHSSGADNQTSPTTNEKGSEDAAGGWFNSALAD